MKTITYRTVFFLEFIFVYAEKYLHCYMFLFDRLCAMPPKGTVIYRIGILLTISFDQTLPLVISLMYFAIP